jgi:hypothetical protein
VQYAWGEADLHNNCRRIRVATGVARQQIHIKIVNIHAVVRLQKTNFVSACVVRDALALIKNKPFVTRKNKILGFVPTLSAASRHRTR